MLQKKISNTERQFSRAASTYDLEANVHRNVASYLIAHGELPITDKKIIDIGSGTGILSDHLLRQYYPQQIYNLDLSFKMLEKGKLKVPSAHFIQANMQELPFQNIFNVVVSNMSLQWLEDPKLIVAAVNNCLCKAGTFAISVVQHGTFKVITDLRRALLDYDSPDSDLASQAERLPTFENLKAEFNHSEFVLKRAEKHIFRQQYLDPSEPFNAIRKLGISGSSRRTLSKDEYEKLLISYKNKLIETKDKPELDYVVGFFWGTKLKT